MRRARHGPHSASDTADSLRMYSDSPGGRIVLLLRHKHSLFSYAAFSLRGRIVLYSDGRLSHSNSLCNGWARRASTMCTFGYSAWTFHTAQSHGRLSYGSVMYSIRRHHLQCVCHEAAWAAPAALSSAAALPERHFFTWHLSPARYTYLATRQHFLATAKQNQQDFSSRESTLDFSSVRSQLLFSIGFSQRWFSSGFLIVIIMLNVRIFSTAHHRCGITITEPTHKSRRLIQRYVRECNSTQIHAAILYTSALL